MQERRVVKTLETDGLPASSAVTAGGLVFASGVAGVGADGKPAGPDIQAQTRRAIEQLGAVLSIAGSSLRQATAVTVYLKSPTDFEAMNAVYREAFADQPPTRTTVVTDLPSGRLITMSAIAVPNGAPRETLHPAGWMKSPRPYSYIVRAGDFVFLSGLVSRKGTNDEAVPGPVSTQTSTILDNAAVLLRTAGLTFANVVSARVFLTDDSLFEGMNDEYRRYFTNEPPARATAITGLVGLGSMVEITLIAYAQPKLVLGPAVAPTLPVSTAVRAGDFLFLAGVLGNTDANANDLTGQTRETLARIRRTLDGLGLSFDHVVDNLIYMSDIWQLKQVDNLLREVFPLDPPARTAVGTKLVTRAGLIEMMMTATAR